MTIRPRCFAWLGGGLAADGARTMGGDAGDRMAARRLDRKTAKALGIEISPTLLSAALDMIDQDRRSLGKHRIATRARAALDHPSISSSGVSSFSFRRLASADPAGDG